MKLLELHSGDVRLAEIDRIYQEAFPPEERFPLEILMRLADKGIFDVYALCEDESTVGMLVISVNEKTEYICFFAVDKSRRGNGLGSEALRLACSLYPDKQIVVEIEALDPSAPNFDQRKRREGFYLRHGFAHTDRYIRYCGVTYELLYSGAGTYDYASFERIMESRRGNDFQPVFFSAKQYSTYIFDLDGTLLDTLTDLTNSANYAVLSVGCPAHTKDEVCSFVGNGIKKLIKRALTADADDEMFETAFANFKAHYKDHCLDNTQPYPHIMDMLRKLKASGKKVAVVSNKADFATRELCNDIFGELVDFCAGEKEGVQRKPAPDTVLKAMDFLGSKPGECVYIGDSDVDIKTASNAGIDCISVLWGFRSEKFLTENGAKTFAQTPNEILLLTLL